MDALSFQGRTCTTANQKLDISDRKNLLSLARGKIDVYVNMLHEKVIKSRLFYNLHVNFFFCCLAGKLMYEDQRRNNQKEEELNEITGNQAAGFLTSPVLHIAFIQSQCSPYIRLPYLCKRHSELNYSIEGNNNNYFLFCSFLTSERMLYLCMDSINSIRTPNLTVKMILEYAKLNKGESVPSQITRLRTW